VIVHRTTADAIAVSRYLDAKRRRQAPQVRGPSQGHSDLTPAGQMKDALDGLILDREKTNAP
jgi:hypothetical protein